MRTELVLNQMEAVVGGASKKTRARQIAIAKKHSGTSSATNEGGTSGDTGTLNPEVENQQICEGFQVRV